MSKKPSNIAPINSRINVLAQGSAEHFSGPIPPPQIIQHYESVLPGAAERIIQMAEKEQQARHAVLVREHQDKMYGKIAAFLLSMLFLAAGVLLALHNHDVVAGIIFSTTIASLISVFVIGKIYKATDK